MFEFLRPAYYWFKAHVFSYLKEATWRAVADLKPIVINAITEVEHNPSKLTSAKKRDKALKKVESQLKNTGRKYAKRELNFALEYWVNALFGG